uniref:Uncharacterized protein n=1 Tax=Molossus molossus TaxID=27622 RepID=A0A7J8E2R9_MOLMO|nr:hypothetical protein HJG59_009034 [Molossus molossus]
MKWAIREGPSCVKRRRCQGGHSSLRHFSSHAVSLLQDGRALHIEGGEEHRGRLSRPWAVPFSQSPAGRCRVPHPGLRRRPGSSWSPPFPQLRSVRAGDKGESGTHSPSRARRENGEAQGRGTGRRE